MFVEGRGPLYNFLSALGRPMDDCGHGRSALAQLAAEGDIGPECIAVHLNDLEEPRTCNCWPRAVRWPA